MAGNRQVFEQAMRRGTNFAWDRQWDKAIAEYERAVAELPDEAPAYTALGQALVHAGRVKEALQVYQRAARLTPDDPLALTHVAEVQERLADISGAARTWLVAADIHLRRRAIDAAIKVWQHVVEIAPDTPPAHERLAKAYAGMEQIRKAVRQYLTLAAIYQEKGDVAQASSACQRALELESRNPDVLAALEALQHGRLVSELIKNKSADLTYATFESDVERPGFIGSPVEMTRQKALEDLAGALLEELGAGGMELTSALMQAIDCQTRGDAEAAITHYEKALRAGAQHPAVSFNLGLLYQEKLRFEDAVKHFRQVLGEDDYSLGAHFALGECLRALGRLDQAVEPFIQVLRYLDLSTVADESVDELEQVYDDLVHRYTVSEKPGAVASFVNALVEFLSGDQWEEHLIQTRNQINRLGGNRVISLAEIFTLPDSKRILASMVRSQEFLEQGMLRSASEECLWAIERAPAYLPLHLHLARLFIQGNQLRMAIGKFLFVADTLAAREEMDQARLLYEQVLQFAPMDLDVRRKLIGLLREHRLLEQALEHQLALAEAYYELAQIEESRAQYHEALRMASRLPSSKKWTARILHRLGDIDLQRLDWRSAIEVYRQLKDAVPDDEKARQRLIELHFNLQRRSEAVAELDELVAFYRQQGNLKTALQALEDMAETRPDELELHKRAAQVSVESGDKAGAIAHLDAMGELQLQEGQIQEARATIKAIIALRPENIEAYRQLLEQIS